MDKFIAEPPMMERIDSDNLPPMEELDDHAFPVVYGVIEEITVYRQRGSQNLLFTWGNTWYRIHLDRFLRFALSHLTKEEIRGYIAT